MQPLEKVISPGVAQLIPAELQEFLWSLHEANPLLSSIFELRKGRSPYTQHISRLIPYSNQRHTIEIAHPLHDIKITILQTETSLLMRLSSKQLEADLSRQPPGPEQGHLF